MTTNVERRALKELEVRASNGSNGRMLAGVAIKYGATAQLPGFTETIAPGACKRVLADPNFDCRFLLNHNSDVVLGRTKSGTLRVNETRQGLAYECDLPDTQAANDLYTTVKRGDITGCSFGFLLGEGDDDFSYTKGVTLRTITNFRKLMDISPVTYPAYEASTVEARNIGPMPERVKRQFERIVEMRRRGFKGPIWQSPLARFLVDRPVDHSASIQRRRNLLNTLLQ